MGRKEGRAARGKVENMSRWSLQSMIILRYLIVAQLYFGMIGCLNDY